MDIKQIQSMTEVDSADWNRLCADGYPFLRHEFLLALEQSTSVCRQTGWEAAHLLVLDDGKLVAFMPLYRKHHSYGEYVFDHQWAAAYQQNGRAYYPKYLTAIPLSPCQGPRIAIDGALDPTAVIGLLVAAVKQLSAQQGVSSWHCLFPTLPQSIHLQDLGLSLREGVQFQWFNRGYRDFDDFLQTLTASKRKMVKRERRRVSEQGITLLHINGTDVTAEQWQVFFQFYSLTYLKRGAQPYLNLAFFLQIAATMGGHILLVLAVKDQQYVGAALSFIGNDTLYGRYWGCYDDYHSLHFEACYYQGLDYCIAHGLARFDSGAQGEHKIARGFEPVTTYSAHWIKEPQFAKAIAQFLAREQLAVQHYKQDASTYLPFKK
ncbi:MAG: GNAT family N-acetyltransferase [Methylococcales bacterium]|nr:GNAT family N-acetyltransferase [Methylococcales bacterium]